MTFTMRSRLLLSLFFSLPGLSNASVIKESRDTSINTLTTETANPPPRTASFLTSLQAVTTTVPSTRQTSTKEAEVKKVIEHRRSPSRFQGNDKTVSRRVEKPDSRQVEEPDSRQVEESEQEAGLEQIRPGGEEGQQPENPKPTHDQLPPEPASKKGGVDTGSIVGGTVADVLGIAVILVGCIIKDRKVRIAHQAESDEEYEMRRQRM